MNQILETKKAIHLQQWQQRINEYYSSGIPLKEWLEQNNISRDSYYYWLRKVRSLSLNTLPAEVQMNLLRSKQNTSPALTQEKIAFKKLEVESPIVNMQPAVIIRLPNATLEISNNATQHTVEAVLLALKTIC